ncbi:MAG: heavy metal-binding domain-containing protein [Vicingaceae bacterium]|nr:hypothetical protein [Flavobacteriales bacterium]MDF1674662.1 heavy metal-binding domain-containing protein [Vicingaceae bacterium]
MKYLNRNIVLLTALFCSINVYSQHDHGSHGSTHATSLEQPPHGGIVKKVGKYKIEMVTELFLKNDQLRFYILKSNLKSILNEEVTGEVTIESNDGETYIQTLQAKGNDFFVAQLKSSESFQATVKFIIKGKTISTVFTHQGIEVNQSSTYSCPMHPEIESDTSGTCPKCGMNLEKQ